MMSIAVTPATIAMAMPMFSRSRLPPLSWVASVARSRASPATRPQIQGIGSFEARMPTPVAISRTP
jgi:hypothetical protein